MAVHIHIHNVNAGQEAVRAAKSVPARTRAIRAKFEGAVKFAAKFLKPNKPKKAENEQS
jgi:hypothetical protein